MDFDQMFPSSWLTPDDIGDQDVVKQVASITMEQGTNPKTKEPEDQYVLNFLDGMKMRLNKTNATRLKAMFGTPDACANQWVSIYVEDTNFGPGLRIRKTPAQPAAAPVQPAPQTPAAPQPATAPAPAAPVQQPVAPAQPAQPAAPAAPAQPQQPQQMSPTEAVENMPNW